MSGAYPSINGIPCNDPGDLYPQSIEQRLPLDFWGRANSLSCPLGSEPGECWLLLLREDVDRLQEYLTAPNFSEIAFRDGTAEVKFKQYVFVSATCMTPGVAGDKKAAYLARLLDKRHLLKMSAIGSDTAGEGQYNVRYPAPPDATAANLYYEESLDGGSLWTWQSMLSNLWAKLPSALAGSSPTLPYTPGGDPENFRFIGVSAWDAYNAVLAKISCAIKLDPTTGLFTIVRLGTEQDGLAAEQSKLKQHRILDWEPIEPDAANCPEKIRVLFHRHNKLFGETNADLRTGSFAMQPVYEVDKATGISGAIAGTFLTLWDDRLAVYDETGTITNSSALNDRATEVAANYVNNLNRSSDRLRVYYGGVHKTILPGSQVKEVTWRDYGDGEGVITEVACYPAMDSGAGHLIPGVAEQLLPPDLGRATIGPIRQGVGKAAETIANRASGDVTIWKGDLGSETTTSIDVAMFNFGPRVEAGDWVSWTYIYGQLAFVKLCEGE